MAKISAAIEDQPTQIDQQTVLLSPAGQPIEDQPTQIQAASRLSTSEKIEQEKLKHLQLKTAREIERLERAKEKAKSDAVKQKLQAEIEAAKARKEAEEKARREQSETAKTIGTVAAVGSQVGSSFSQAASNTVDRVQQTVDNVAGTLETISTPGSIFLPIAILLIFFFLILPVNGFTRAQWLWMSLIGDAQITPGGASPTSGGSGEGGDEESVPSIAAGYREFSGVQYG
jgi:Fe2+ transport system protein B